MRQAEPYEAVERRARRRRLIGDFIGGFLLLMVILTWFIFYAT